MSTTYGYGITVPAPAGLDPDRYVFTLGVHRRNGAALTEAEVKALAAALAPLATATHEAAGDPAKVARLAAENEAKHKAMVKKATGKKAPAKGPKKAAAKASRKPAAKPTRKAARRPSRG